MATGRLSSPGEHAARARVEAVYAAIDRLSPADLTGIAGSSIDLDDRDARLAELERLADGAGRGELLDEARDALSDAVIARLADMRPYPDGLYARGSARAEDQAATVAALRDLVAVAVMQDRLEPDDARALAKPGLHVLGSRLPVLEDPAWADLAAPEVEAAPMPAPAGAPTEAEWAAAAVQARSDAPGAEGDEGYSPPGTRLMRRAFFGIIAVTGSLAAVVWGIGEDRMLVGLLVAGAVLALCWTFATWSPRRG